MADKVLEHTLSMGHKIQQLSYNPSQDSVDVIQYYANFAENEVPQIYKYSLWSTLVQVRSMCVCVYVGYDSQGRIFGIRTM